MGYGASLRRAVGWKKPNRPSRARTTPNDRRRSGRPLVHGKAPLRGIYAAQVIALLRDRGAVIDDAATGTRVFFSTPMAAYSDPRPMKRPDPPRQPIRPTQPGCRPVLNA